MSFPACYPKINSFEELKGRTIKAISGLEKESECVKFTMEDNSIVELYHQQDCCESVQIEDVCGDPEDLLNAPIREAEETVGESEDTDWGTQTWTFYRISAGKGGGVVIRWCGESNGYYSESVDFRHTPAPKTQAQLASEQALALAKRAVTFAQVTFGE